MKEYSGQEVAVLWSGGFDSTFLALQLAKAGAHVTCVYDTSFALQKLGDVLNRSKVSSLLESVGVVFHEVQMEHIRESDEKRYSNYSVILKKIVECIAEEFPNATIATGVLSTDMQCNEVVEQLQEYEVEHPLKAYSHKEYRVAVESACDEHHELANLSKCDFGQVLHIPRLNPCTIAKPRELWCFKCHEAGVDYVEKTYDDQHLVTSIRETYPDITIGWLLGHVVAGKANKRPSIVTRQKHFKSGRAIEGDFPVTLQLKERESTRKKHSDARRFPKTEIVDIWLSDLKRLMGDRVTETLIQNTPNANLLIKGLVENNYLPVGYEWDMHEIKVLWSAK